MKKTAVVIQDLEKPVLVEVLERSIVEIARSMKKLLNGRVSRRAIILLIQDNTTPKISQNDIIAVLDSIEDLERKYIHK